MNLVEQSLPAISTALLTKGRTTIGHETNLSRSPLWHVRKRAAHIETVVAPALYGHPFRQVEGRDLTTSDQHLFAHLTTEFVRWGCPEDRRVAFSLGDAALALGYEDLGGKQRALVRASLARLRCVTLESAVRHPDGHETVRGWGLVDGYTVTSRGGGKGWITMSEEVSELLREGSVTFLHGPTWKAITDEDDVAGRLWSFLEAETIGRGWRYSLFRPDDGLGSMLPSQPSISDVVMLHWVSRNEVAKRVRRACQAIKAHDPRYRLDVVVGREPNNWILECSRSTHVPTTTSPDGLPQTVIRAWRNAHRSHLPSARQRTILAELLTRHSADWISGTLDEARNAGSDGLNLLLSKDRATSSERIDTARRVEDQWEKEKRGENVGAEQSLGELLELIGRRPSVV